MPKVKAGGGGRLAKAAATFGTGKNEYTITVGKNEKVTIVVKK